MLDEGSILGNAIKGITPFIHSSMVSHLKSKLPKYVNITYTEIDDFTYRGVKKTINDVIHEDGAKLYKITGLPVNDKFNEFEIFMDKKIDDLIRDGYLPNISQYLKTSDGIVQLQYGEQYISFDGYHAYIALTDEYLNENIVSITYDNNMTFETKTYNFTRNGTIITLFDLEEDYIKLNQVLVDNCNFIAISSAGMESSISIQKAIRQSDINDWVVDLDGVSSDITCGVILFYYYSDSRYYTVYDKIMSLCDNNDEFTKFISDMNKTIGFTSEEFDLINSKMDYDIHNDSDFDKMMKILEYDTDKFAEYYSDERNIYTIQTTGKAILDLDGKISLQSKKNSNTKCVVLIFVNGKLLHNFYELQYRPMYVTIPNVKSYVSYDDIVELVYIFGIVPNADEDEEFDISDGAVYDSNYVDYDFFTDSCDAIFNISDKKTSTCQYRLLIDFVFDDETLKFKPNILTNTFDDVEVEYKNIGKVVKSYKNKYRYVSYTITDKCVGIPLPDVFKYCQDTSRYVIFLNGYKVNAQDIIFTIPNPTNPFFELAVYFKYILSEGDVLDIFYLPSGFYSDTFDKVNGYFALTLNSEELSFNLDPKYGMVFIDGLKVDNNSIRKIKSNTIQITRLFPNINNAELLLDDTVVLDQSNTILDQAISIIEEKSPDTVYSPIRTNIISDTTNKPFNNLAVRIIEKDCSSQGMIPVLGEYNNIINSNCYQDNCYEDIIIDNKIIGCVRFYNGCFDTDDRIVTNPTIGLITKNPDNPIGYDSAYYNIHDLNNILYHDIASNHIVSTKLIKMPNYNDDNLAYCLIAYASGEDAFYLYPFKIIKRNDNYHIQALLETKGELFKYYLDFDTDFLSGINNFDSMNIYDIQVNDTSVLLLFNQYNDTKLITFAITIQFKESDTNPIQSTTSMNNFNTDITFNGNDYYLYPYNVIKSCSSIDSEIICNFTIQYYLKDSSIYKPLNIETVIHLDESTLTGIDDKCTINAINNLENFDDTSYVGTIEQLNGAKLISPPVQFTMLDNEVCVTIHNDRGNGIDAVVFKKNSDNAMEKIISHYIPTPYSITLYETDCLANRNTLYDKNNYNHGGSINIYPRAYKINENYIVITSPKGILGFLKVYKDDGNNICVDFDDSMQSIFDCKNSIYYFSSQPLTMVDENNNIIICMNYIGAESNGIVRYSMIYDVHLDVCTSTGFGSIFSERSLDDISVTINEIVLYYYGTIYDGTNFVYTFDKRGIAKILDNVSLLNATTGKENIPNISHDYFNN